MTITIKDLVRQVKSKQQTGTAYKIRIPAPDKEFAKAEGARWNKDLGYYQIYTNDIDLHALKNYRVDGNDLWLPVKNIPFDFREEFKAQGIVTEKQDDKFVNYVLAVEKYLPLIEGLQELDLL